MRDGWEERGSEICAELFVLPTVAEAKADEEQKSNRDV